MNTPTTRAQQGWPLQSSVERENGSSRKGKGRNTRSTPYGKTPTSNNDAEVMRTTTVENTFTEVSVVEVAAAPPVRSLDGGRGPADVGQSEPEIWQRFHEVGSLDMESLEKKDRAALQARVATLEAEVGFSFVVDFFPCLLPNFRACGS
jgi:hypothetical protein